MPPQANVQVGIRVNRSQVLAQTRAIGAKMNSALSKVKPIAGVLGGVGGLALLGSITKQTIAFDGALTRLAIQAGISRTEEQKLRKEITDTAIETGIARDEVLAFTQGVTDMTGDLRIARDAMLASAKASAITGADMNGLGLIASDAATKFGLSGEKLEEALNVAIEAGFKGRYTLNEFARTSAQAMSVAGLAGMQGAEGFREMVATLQVMRMGFGTAEETVTGFRTAVLTLADPAKLKQIEKMFGITTEDPKTGKLRAFGDLFLEILEKSEADIRPLAYIFGKRGIQAVAEFRAELIRNEGNIDAVRERINEFANVTASASDAQERFERATEGAEGRLDILKQRLLDVLDKALIKENMDAFIGALNELIDVLPAFSKILQFLVDHKEEIFMLWLARGVGGGAVTTIGSTLLGGGGAAAMAAGGARGAVGATRAASAAATGAAAAARTAATGAATTAAAATQMGAAATGLTAALGPMGIAGLLAAAGIGGAALGTFIGRRIAEPRAEREALKRWVQSTQLGLDVSDEESQAQQRYALAASALRRQRAGEELTSDEASALKVFGKVLESGRGAASLFERGELVQLMLKKTEIDTIRLENAIKGALISSTEEGIRRGFKQTKVEVVIPEGLKLPEGNNGKTVHEGGD